jgi:sodium/hydrogen exchanger 8
LNILPTFGLVLQIGLLSAYTIKRLYLGKHSTDREIAVMILMAYLSYILAEVSNTLW